MESVAIVNEVEYIDDSKGTNVGATVAALNSLGNDKNGKKIIVILGGDGKGQDFSPLTTPIADFVHDAVLIGKDADNIALALEAITDVTLHRAKNLPDAVVQCAAIAKSGDIVLLSPACASLDMFQDYTHRALVFVQSVQALAADGGSA
jgi:UDP-N-acetylmuramoylalanine--D-glutamate ligase